MNYKIITSEIELLDFKNRWNNFYATSEKSNIFQSYIWNYSWWKKAYPNNKLLIIVFFKTSIDDPNAIFPLMLDYKGMVRSIADTHSDYCNILIKAEKFDFYDIFKTLAKIIHNHKEIKSILLTNIPQSSNYLGQLSTIFDEKQLILSTNASSYVDFKKCEELLECFSYLKAKKKNKIKKLYQQCSNYETFYYTQSKNSFPLEVILEIRSDMIERHARRHDFLHDTLLKVIQDIYESGNIMIQETKKDGKPVALNFIMHPENTNSFLLWISLYKDIPKIHIVSYYLLIKYLNNIYKEGEIFTLDFGRGLYDYKIVNFLPDIEQHYSIYYFKSYTMYIWSIGKIFIKNAIKPFYKKNKQAINRILRK